MNQLKKVFLGIVLMFFTLNAHAFWTDNTPMGTWSGADIEVQDRHVLVSGESGGGHHTPYGTFKYDKKTNQWVSIGDSTNYKKPKERERYYCSIDADIEFVQETYKFKVTRREKGRLSKYVSPSLSLGFKPSDYQVFSARILYADQDYIWFSAGGVMGDGYSTLLFGYLNFDTEEWKFFSNKYFELPHLPSIGKIARDKDIFWIGTCKFDDWGTDPAFGIIRFDVKKEIFQKINNFNSGLAGDGILDIEIDGNYIWFATTGGVSRYNKITKEWKTFNIQRGLIIKKPSEENVFVYRHFHEVLEPFTGSKRVNLLSTKDGWFEIKLERKYFGWVEKSKVTIINVEKKRYAFSSGYWDDIPAFKNIDKKELLTVLTVVERGQKIVPIVDEVGLFYKIELDSGWVKNGNIQCLLESIHPKPILAREGFLTIAITGDLPPLHTKQGGIFSGYDCDVGKILAKELGLKPSFIDPAEQGKSAIEMLFNGEVDLIVSGIILRKAKRLLNSYVGPYLHNSLGYLYSADRKKDIDETFDLHESKVAIVQDSQVEKEDGFCYPGLEKVQRIIVKDYNEALDKFLNGQVDVIIGDFELLKQYSRTLKNIKLTKDTNFYTEQYYIVVLNKDLKKKIQDTLDQDNIRKSLKELKQKWFKQPSEEIAN